MSYVCKICNKEYSTSRGLANHIRCHRISNYEYSLKYDYDGIVPTCACGCGSEMKWRSLGTGFYTYLHGHGNKKTNSRIIKKCLNCGKDFESYVCDDRLYCSLECRSADPKIWDKHKQTMIKNHGVDNIFKSKEFIEKNIQHMNEVYGGIGMSSSILSAKIKETVKEKYGEDNIFKTKKFIENNIQHMEE